MSLPSQASRQLSPCPQAEPSRPIPWQGQGTERALAQATAPRCRGRVPATHIEVQEEKNGGDMGREEEGL